MKTIAQPHTWLVGLVEHPDHGFKFNLTSKDFDFEPRAHHIYPTREQAISAAYCFIRLLNWLSQSFISFETYREIGILKFPSENYRHHAIWIVIDGDRYSWELRTEDGTICARRTRWYRSEYIALTKARRMIDHWQVRNRLFAQLRN